MLPQNLPPPTRDAEAPPGRSPATDQLGDGVGRRPGGTSDPVPERPTPLLTDATYRALRTDLTRRLDGDAALAADLLHDSLLRFLRKQHTLRRDAAAIGFLRTIIARRVADHFRRGPAPAAPLPPEAPEAAPDDDPAAEHERLTASLGIYLATAVAQLPSPLREAVEAVELRGLSQRAYAEAHGLPYSTAKSRVQRGRHLLREAVANCCHVDHDAYGTVLAIRPRCCPRT